MEWLQSTIKHSEEALKQIVHDGGELLRTVSLTKDDSKAAVDEEDQQNQRQKKKQIEELELESVRITDEMIEFVNNLCDHPDTFLIFPLEEFEKESQSSEPEAPREERSGTESIEEGFILIEKPSSTEVHETAQSTKSEVAPNKPAPALVKSTSEILTIKRSRPEKIKTSPVGGTSSIRMSSSADATNSKSTSPSGASNPLQFSKSMTALSGSPSEFAIVPSSADFRLNKRQERHAVLMLLAVPQLAKLRHQLAPKIISEERFWRIYFALMKNKVGNSLDTAKQYSRIPPHELRNERTYPSTRQYISEQSIHVQKSEAFWDALSVESPPEKNTTKVYVRKGIPDSCRQHAWLYLSGALEVEQRNKQAYLEVLSEVFPNIFTLEECEVPKSMLVGLLHKDFYWDDHFLSDKGFEAARRLVWIHIKRKDESVNFPFYADYVCLLLHFLTEEQAYYTTVALSEQSKFAQFFKFDVMIYTPVLLALVKTYLPDLHQYISQNEGIDRNFAENYFARFFVSYLPFQTVLRVMDCFFSDGPATLFKIFLAVLQRSSDILLKTKPERFKQELISQMEICGDAQELIQLAFEFPVKSEHLVELMKQTRNESLPEFADSVIFDQDQFACLWNWLPNRLKLSRLKLLYRCSSHGFSLNTMIIKAKRASPLVLLIKTKERHVLGAFITCALEKTPTYIGNGEMFLFTFHPHPRKFGWSTHNQFFFMIDTRPSVIIGGGTGCGLWLDDELDRGSSEFCETFGNEQLNGEEKDFRCIELELFGFE
eukprot:TRINITY_DN12197_c0_g2_i1.p1 TRINITY_DN12197_c0_g2~~TRINITY_DN12197_c0_g2_i1.p1  ORF type:complete len:771 (-),score=201.43 TRINITY_DN12197_c0_g2_i1:36-2348(-)